MHINKKIIERPQYMWLRVAICLHENDLEKVKTTYDLMSQKYFTQIYNQGSTMTHSLLYCFCHFLLRIIIFYLLDKIIYLAGFGPNNCLFFLFGGHLLVSTHRYIYMCTKHV